MPAWTWRGGACLSAFRPRRLPWSGARLTIPGLVQTIVLSRASGRTGVPEARVRWERLAAPAGLASAAVPLVPPIVDECAEVCLLQDYPRKPLWRLA